MTPPTPQSPPEPLPEQMLSQRMDNRWERLDRAGEKNLDAARLWAVEKLTNVFVAQRLGADEKDEQFMDMVDDLYNTIRNAFTRQDLLRAFLVPLEKQAQEESERRLQEFRDELAVIDEMEAS